MNEGLESIFNCKPYLLKREESCSILKNEENCSFEIPVNFGFEQFTYISKVNSANPLLETNIPHYIDPPMSINMHASQSFIAEPICVPNHTSFHNPENFRLDRSSTWIDNRNIQFQDGFRDIKHSCQLLNETSREHIAFQENRSVTFNMKGNNNFEHIQFQDGFCDIKHPCQLPNEISKEHIAFQESRSVAFNMKANSNFEHIQYQDGFRDIKHSCHLPNETSKEHVAFQESRSVAFNMKENSSYEQIAFQESRSVAFNMKENSCFERRNHRFKKRRDCKSKEHRPYGRPKKISSTYGNKNYKKLSASMHGLHHPMQAEGKTKTQFSEKGLKLLAQKELRNSDVSNLSRIVLHKRDAETGLPQLETKEGIIISALDAETNATWYLRYRYWPNNRSRMYILENTGAFVQSHGLQKGDYMMLYKDADNETFVIKGRKAIPKDLNEPIEERLGKIAINDSHGITDTRTTKTGNEMKNNVLQEEEKMDINNVQTTKTSNEMKDNVLQEEEKMEINNVQTTKTSNEMKDSVLQEEEMMDINIVEEHEYPFCTNLTSFELKEYGYRPTDLTDEASFEDKHLEELLNYLAMGNYE